MGARLYPLTCHLGVGCGLRLQVGDRPHTPSDAGEVDGFAAQQQEKPLTFFDKIKAHEKLGLPLRMVDDAIQRRRMEKQRRADDEARRVWDMLQALQPGCRVKLIGLSKVRRFSYFLSPPCQSLSLSLSLSLSPPSPFSPSLSL